MPDRLLDVEVSDSKVSFTIPFRPASLKNSPRLSRRFAQGGRTVASLRPSAKAELHKGQLREMLLEALGLHRSSVFSDDDVEVTLTHWVAEDTVEVVVQSAGPRPKGKTGRRQDLHNMLELVLDAMQTDPVQGFGGVYDDDRQVVRIDMRRVVP